MALILNIDTSSDNCSVALSNDTKIIAHFENASRNHTKDLLPLINRLYKESGHKTSNMSAVAVNIGPGSYTGLRTGLAVAKGLCYSYNLPIIGITGLDALALKAIKQNNNKVGAYIIVQDNYRSGWYYAVYDQELNYFIAPKTCDNIEEIFQQIPNQQLFLCGIRDESPMPVLNNNIFKLPYINLTAAELVPISNSKFNAAENINILSIAPLYINSIF